MILLIILPGFIKTQIKKTLLSAKSDEKLKLTFFEN